MGEEIEIRRGRAARGDVRCSGCGVLLAKIDASGLRIRRGDLEACIDGRFHAALTCYKPRCRTLNVVRVTTES